MKLEVMNPVKWCCAIFVVAVVCFPQVASACPTCKDSLAENYVAAYGYSIVFMMSMPFIIFGSLVAYFYYEVRKANKAGTGGRATPASASGECQLPETASPSH